LQQAGQLANAMKLMVYPKSVRIQAYNDAFLVLMHANGAGVI